MRRVAVSGGFDPPHSGHLAYLREASQYGELYVILNDTNFLMKKKGYYFYPDEERKAILEHIFGVHSVFLFHASDPNDLSVCEALEIIKPNIFLKGGDRSPQGHPIPEEEICKKLGIEVIYGIGGYDKKNASSSLVEEAFQRYRIMYGGN